MQVRPLTVRPMTQADAVAVLALNLESEWALSPLDEAKLERAADATELALVCEVEGKVAGFTFVYAPLSTYDSPYFAWFCQRYDDFLYLDRIAVSTAFRRRGIASLMYDEVEAAAASHGRLVCEVFSRPPNTSSLEFHRARGYAEVGHLEAPDGRHTVMLEKPL